MRFDRVPLEMLQRTRRRVEGHCVECDAVLHIDLGAVIAAHGKTATLEKVGYTILCPVSRGSWTVPEGIAEPRRAAAEEHRGSSHFGGTSSNKRKPASLGGQD